ncbi:hypothetical protein FA09DRAFT_332100 [Tilletiopsis washingtonensis]|uniref:Uncharacterized protein n=1 Tax=Tilletiopsis washingtonensis TaxID=58919 RepID=A0A316Z1Q1_9BASI|nr:hypothetical protein FA09DRAFT_332100 [Tilletiopsis washingtonensis]PWN95461.1 hypothetical protein FA09DRAFT_332100 [Tilletiopsis washingtonensis]
MAELALAHLPSLPPQSLPLLLSHLSVAHSASSPVPFSLLISSLRASSLSAASTAPRRASHIHLPHSYPGRSFLLISTPTAPTRAQLRAEEASASLGADALALAGLAPNTPAASSSTASGSATRSTLLTLAGPASTLLQRLSLPPPLGAPGSGDGARELRGKGPGNWEERTRVVGEGFECKVGDARVVLAMMRLGAGKGEEKGALLLVSTPSSPTATLSAPLLLAQLFPAHLTPGGVVPFTPSLAAWSEVRPGAMGEEGGEERAPGEKEAVAWEGICRMLSVL